MCLTIELRTILYLHSMKSNFTWPSFIPIPQIGWECDTLGKNTSHGPLGCLRILRSKSLETAWMGQSYVISCGAMIVPTCVPKPMSILCKLKNNSMVEIYKVWLIFWDLERIISFRHFKYQMKYAYLSSPLHNSTTSESIISVQMSRSTIGICGERSWIRSPQIIL